MSVGAVVAYPTSIVDRWQSICLWVQNFAYPMENISLAVTLSVGAPSCLSQVYANSVFKI